MIESDDGRKAIAIGRTALICGNCRTEIGCFIVPYEGKLEVHDFLRKRHAIILCPKCETRLYETDDIKPRTFSQLIDEDKNARK